MRQLSRSNWQCTFCGTEVWVGRGKQPVTVVRAECGSPPLLTVAVDGHVVHRCSAAIAGIRF